MSAHTPGPWKVVDKIDGRKPRSMALVCAGGDMSIDCTRSGDTRSESNANARLIAAAPDLLAALQAMVEQFGFHRAHSGMVHDERMAITCAEEAIAKAQL